MQLSSKGEVADFQQADQFQPAKSQFECGYFGVMMAKSMAQVGKPPLLSVQQIIDQAESWYAQYDGSNASWNMDGMSLQQEYDLLRQVGLHYQATQPVWSVCKKWLEVGYPVLIALAETSVFDLALGSNPYPWNPAGNHIIVLTGVASDGNPLVRDSANCTNLYDPNSLRPGPRHYDGNRMQMISATVVVPLWLPRPVSAVPPTSQQVEGMSMLQIQQATEYFEAQSDGTWKCTKYGTILGHGMLSYYCNTGIAPLYGLTTLGLPLTSEIGPVEGKTGTTYQLFERGILCYDTAHAVDAPPGAGSVYVMHIDSGPGLALLLSKFAPAPTPSNPAKDILAQIAQLKTQVDTFFALLEKQLGA